MTSSLSCLYMDPDISGIGVRITIYAQNLLSFVPAILALWDGKVTAAKLDRVETQSTTILITAFAILIAAIVEARTVTGLSNFQASVVLSLSWMNNTNTFIYYLLYVHHNNGVVTNPSSWVQYLRDNVWVALQKHVEDAEKTNSESPIARMSPIQRVFRRIVLVLGSLHLSLMAGLGVWLWSNPASFGTGDCSIDEISTYILGQSVSLGSGPLRRFSIVIYSLFLVPGFNLLLPMALFLGLFTAYQAFCKPGGCTSPSIVPTVLGLVLLLAINIIFIVDVELTLLEASGQSGWSFGQVLAILLLVLPLRDLLETFLARREKRFEKQRKKDMSKVLKNAIRDRAAPERILELLQDGADVNTRVEDDDYATVLQLASQREQVDLVKAILDYGATVDMRGGKYETALQAGARGSPEIVKLLLERGADPNIEGGAYGGALKASSVEPVCWEIVQLLLAHSETKVPPGAMNILEAASDCGNLEVVRLLLEKGVDPNVQGSKNRAALYAAAYGEEPEIVKLLLEQGADPDVQGGEYGTPLQAASYTGRLETVRLLLEKGANVNVAAGRYKTALQAASRWGNLEIVKLLLDKGADLNVQGGEHGTALQAALYGEELEVVKLLLENIRKKLP